MGGYLTRNFKFAVTAGKMLFGLGVGPIRGVIWSYNVNIGRVFGVAGLCEVEGLIFSAWRKNGFF